MDFSFVLYLLVHIYQSLFNAFLNFCIMFRGEVLILKLDFLNLCHSAVLSCVALKLKTAEENSDELGSK